MCPRATPPPRPSVTGGGAVGGGEQRGSGSCWLIILRRATRQYHKTFRARVGALRTERARRRVAASPSPRRHLPSRSSPRMGGGSKPPAGTTRRRPPTSRFSAARWTRTAFAWMRVPSPRRTRIGCASTRARLACSSSRTTGIPDPPPLQRPPPGVRLGGNTGLVGGGVPAATR